MNFEIFSVNDLEFVLLNMSAVIFLGAFIWAGNVIIAHVKAEYKRFFVDLPRHRRGKLAVEKARRFGTVAVYNQEKGITAVSPYWDFISQLAIEKLNIQETTDEERKLRRSLAPMMVMPMATFTFADPEEGCEGCQFVTGTELDAELILNAVVEKATGYSRSQIPVESFKYIRHILVRRDRRLLVPFVKEGHLPNGEVMMFKKTQVELFGGRTKRQAREALLNFS